MEALQRLAWVNARGGVNRINGRVVGSANIPNARLNGVGSATTTTVGGPEIEIHVIPGGPNEGIPVTSSGSSLGGSIDSGNMRDGLPGSVGVVAGGRRGSRGSSGLGNDNIGAPGRINVNVETSTGSDAGYSGVGRGGNFGFGNTGGGERLVGNAGATSRIIGGVINENGGGGGTSVSINNVMARAGRNNGARGRSTAVVGVAGITTTSRGPGSGPNGSPGRFGSEAPEMTSGAIAGVDSILTTSGARRRNNANIGTGAVVASYAGNRRLGASSIGRGNGAFSGAVGTISEGTAVGGSGRAGASAFAPGNLLLEGDNGDAFGAGFRDNEGSGPGDDNFDDGDEVRRPAYEAEFRG